ncbi:NAD(P)-binding domain [Cordyceps militaris CM01]|uniref:NAD(P)-binding domain n=1 Tax=Cordyceps militaris (strain CM01) TaxID=983644 RepID=G3J4W5_CORMM|nr:NAD(P)-binding domain [Cordyceps militaris CM01]EGX95932.1 NAD(P)-binding domain [Cordyceps militaris CM01]
MPSKVGMPIEPPALVAVTGANGFIAQHCIAALLQHGYRVVGTVRAAAKAAAVQHAHGHHPKLTVAVVADITDPAQYRAVLAPLAPAAVLHLAAPFHYRATDFETELMVPAVRGATAILDACAAIPDAPTAYRASKTAAERAAWAFMKDRPVAFDMVSLCPAMVFGPFLPKARPRAVADVNTSNRIVWGVVSAGRAAPVPPTKGPVWVDVRDVADAHVRALVVPEAGGGRYLLAQGVYCNQEIADVARRVAPMADRIPVGTPGTREAQGHFGVDAAETERVLGVKWRGLDECLRSLVPQLFEMEE